MAAQLSIWSYRGYRFAAVTRRVLPGPRTSIVRGNYVRETSVKKRNKIVHEIARNVANVFSFYAIMAIEHGFQCINVRQVPWEVLKTAAFGNTSHGTWQMLMHEKPCLIPILNYHHNTIKSSLRFRLAKTKMQIIGPYLFNSACMLYSIQWAGS